MAALYGKEGTKAPFALVRKQFCARHGWKPWEFDQADMCLINEWLWLDDLEARAKAHHEKRERDKMLSDLRNQPRGGF